MSEQIAIEQGQSPWAPAADAELVRTLHVYDMPLIGVIRQGGSLHLFRCIEGQVDANNLWAYTAVDDVDLGAFDAAGPDDLDDVIDRVVEGRPVVVALSREGDGILASALVRDPGAYPTLPRRPRGTPGPQRRDRPEAHGSRLSSDIARCVVIHRGCGRTLWKPLAGFSRDAPPGQSKALVPAAL